MTQQKAFSPEQLRRAILDLLAELPPGKSISPTEAARRLLGSDERQWSRLMKPLRAVAIEMAHNGEIVILRKNKPADPAAFRGVYRLALPGAGNSPASETA
ncbi:uncharacterized protein DUF3253 [Hoeflea halophila]|uniref:Uncharacterized protein DUF3253 n=1 Tax=Hoeflea halophila TaxID=714899 RepID=A0A286IEZ4_9HYPH|nr:DUF3253 domain-containing protein [Hoeflea halophila]SOE18680.1 uncharacterized protein DUF3253 [Hoeflea halophila]